MEKANNSKHPFDWLQTLVIIHKGSFCHRLVSLLYLYQPTPRCFEVKLELTPSMLSRIPAYVQMLIINKKPSCHIINLKKKYQLWLLLFFNKKITNKRTPFRHIGNQTHHHLPKPASRLYEESKLSKHWGDSETKLWVSTRGVTFG